MQDNIFQVTHILEIMVSIIVIIAIIISLIAVPEQFKILLENMYEKGWEIHSLLESFLEDMDFYNKENAYVLYGNHLTGAFSAFLNLYHDNCKLTPKEKRKYIRRIIDRPYVKECAVNRKSDRGIIGLTSLLIRMNNTLLISAAFKGISLARKVKA